MRKYLAVLALFSSQAMAAQLTVNLELPQLNVAEYHRPYVAIWVEQPNQTHVANLSVWYDLKLKDKEGEKWLKDMRQWWRRSGRSLEMPVDGVSAATRAVGTHSLTFDEQHPAFKNLPAGDYNIVIEAAREVGGRELQKLPFTWPISQEQTVNAQGKTELGALSLTLTP